MCFLNEEFISKWGKLGKGMNFNIKLIFCYICKRKFENKEIILAFKCGHFLHNYCCFNRLIGCPICFNKLNVSAYNWKYNILKENNNKKNENIKKNNHLFPLYNNRPKINSFINSIGFLSLRRIDNYTIEKKHKFYFDCAASCRDKYRKVVFDD